MIKFSRVKTGRVTNVMFPYSKESPPITSTRS